MNKKILHTVVEHIARQFPERIAVRQGNEHFTYHQLVTAAHQAAQQLRAQGVSKDIIVGLYFENSIAFVTAMVAVMKAGGIFLPLDPSLPAKRLEFVLKNTTPRVILCARHLSSALNRVASSHLSEATPSPYCLMEMDFDGRLTPLTATPVNIPAAPEADMTAQPIPVPEADDPLYLFYTSGSTGVPKAILGCQKGVSHFIHWEVKEFGWDHHLRVSQLAPVSFDACLKDIFVPLITGGSVCIPEKDVRQSIPRLVDWAEASELTVIHCVPSLFRMLLKECESRSQQANLLPHLKHIILAGEAIYGKDVNRFLDLFGNRVELVNFYGPTETTVIKTCHRIRERVAHPAAMVHVGHPIANTAILITKGNRLCEIGEIGDILIKTPFRTLGYYNDPEQTQTRFIPNPLQADPNDIVYKTGDLGRYRPDRSIEYIGRLDFQVKVNGVRINLLEIETILSGHPEIAEAVVSAPKNAANESALVCYFKPLNAEEPKTLPASDIRAYLAAYLPAYMIPSAYVEMDQFPLSLNGKIDRKALPKPEALLAAEKPGAQPNTPTEKQLVQIWKAVLGHETIDTESPFFEIGGHSLKAIQVVSRIYKEMQVELSLKDFFENATIGKLARLIDRRTPAPYLSITPAPDQTEYDLSHAQRRLWILDQMDEGGTAYSMPGAYLFSGPLNTQQIEHAFQELIVRHESLRTTFCIVDGTPKQVIHPDLPGGRFKLATTDLTSVFGKYPPTEDQPNDSFELLMPYIAREISRPFDLVKGPLVNLRVFILAAEKHLILFNMHHIIGDGWSVDQLAQDLFTRYKSLENGEESPLPKLSIQYKDFAAWQNRLLDSEAVLPAKLYWHTKLANAPAALELPTDFKRPAIQRYRGQTQCFEWDEAFTAQLEHFSRNHDVSLFMTLLAGLKLFCFHYSGQTDLIIGTPVAGRHHPDLEHQVGFYVNTLALRDTFTPDVPFKQLVSQVKQTILDAYTHQHYPFDRLVDELTVPRDVGRAPLFDVMLVFQTDDTTYAVTDQLTFTEIDLETHTSRFDLTFIFNLSANRLTLKLNYNTDLWQPSSIARMAGHLQHVIIQALNQAEAPIRTLHLMSEAERIRLRTDFDGPHRDYPLHRSLMALFDDQAHRTPEQTALIFEDRVTTYGELRTQAETMAHWLIADWGLQPGEIVGLMMDRSDLSVLLLLSILKAGGIYLPLDPTYPQSRLQYMIENSQCRRIIADRANIERATASPIQACCYDDVAQSIMDRPSAANSLSLLSTDGTTPAWVLYTSGSTGQPKGIQLNHGGYVNTICNLIEQFTITPADRVLQFTPSSFDICLTEIFSALLAGATLVIADRNRIDNPNHFIDYLDQHQVTVAALPPTYLNTLDRGRVSRLRVLITGGEPPIRGDVDYYRKQLTYFNAYGPSETSAYASMHSLTAADEYELGIPIGKPFPNTAIHIVSPDLLPLPIGVVGELCISGVGLAQGYLDNPLKTAQAFVENPLAPGERMYRTGDMGRRLENGDILFLGRKDLQIKIRGFRVELGEIETHLMRHPQVNQAVVIKDTTQDALIAYLTLTQSITSQVIKSYLSEQLPDYMVPNQFIILSELPLTPTGKIDRKALPQTSSITAPLTEIVPPRNTLESELVAVFKTVLTKTDIGIYDNFFELGGTSLHTIKAVVLIFERLNLNVSAKDLFLHPTVANLAQAVTPRLKSDPPQRPISATRPAISSNRVSVERRPLMPLLGDGTLPPVDSVALDYITDDLLTSTYSDKNQLLREWFPNGPVLTAVTDTFMGRIGFITLPCFSSDLINNDNGLKTYIQTALNMAESIGAKSVSLTGLLPTAIWSNLASICGNGNGSPVVTTGQATIAATMVMNMVNLLSLTQRSLQKERLAVIGLGQLGIMSLKLALALLPHPAEIFLAGLHENDAQFASLKESLQNDSGYTGPITPITLDQAIPETVYQATLMLATAQVPDLLNIDLIQPGTLIIDDPGNYLLSPGKALLRSQQHHDLLITEGDRIICPRPSAKVVFLPDHIQKHLSADHLKSYLEPDLSALTGCVLSGLLVHKCSNLAPTQGSLNLEACQAHYEQLQSLEFKAAPLHYGGKTIDQIVVDRFSRNYGTMGTS